MDTKNKDIQDGQRAIAERCEPMAKTFDAESKMIRAKIKALKTNLNQREREITDYITDYIIKKIDAEEKLKARIERLEAENKRLRESLTDGDVADDLEHGWSEKEDEN